MHVGSQYKYKQCEPNSLATGDGVCIEWERVIERKIEELLMSMVDRRGDAQHSPNRLLTDYQ